ncbi:MULTISPECIES: hypothetical protein [Pseudomonas]|uniref:Uncharacterized protein n=1 Tax=Pseudomonas citronellolis TaxID=53408 RepID=A0A1A9KEQ1_9PSED|nr:MULTISPECIES: hypothetical protein [Pseudomonas]ANI16306.1 hypothetical protein A9C11_21055 [Pseudomonas citronellolis]EJU9614652.1 hypothetical protein [Pseudomonas aeruginosa]EKU2928209.1 hypothetical protein [Pseudomonas aeruginosa]ELM0223522.1 hypothetical protein [Pseudomonas aeruginosa]KSE83495.1 hypothetical protein AO924_12890 [Pseudomonas aeruginosa]
MRRTNAAEKKRRQELRTIALLVIVLLSMAGGIGWYFLQRPTAIDKLTLCPASGPLGHYVVLVDNTDPYNFIQRQAFAQGLKALADKLVPEGYLLSVYALGEDFTQTAKPLFEKCNPGTAVGKSELDSNPTRIQERFEREFREPVTQLENVLMQDKPADKSPIFEMLQLVAINSFQSENIQGPKTLVVYSDMLANTSEFSMFKGQADFDGFAASAYGQKSQTRLDGVQVKLNYLMNYPKLQTRKQLAFWERYFEKAGARLVAVTPVEG